MRRRVTASARRSLSAEDDRGEVEQEELDGLQSLHSGVPPSLTPLARSSLHATQRS